MNFIRRILLRRGRGGERREGMDVKQESSNFRVV